MCCVVSNIQVFTVFTFLVFLVFKALCNLMVSKDCSSAITFLPDFTTLCCNCRGNTQGFLKLEVSIIHGSYTKFLEFASEPLSQYCTRSLSFCNPKGRYSEISASVGNLLRNSKNSVMVASQAALSIVALLLDLSSLSTRNTPLFLGTHFHQC